MVTLEQVKQLEERIVQAIEYVTRVTGENKLLQGKLDGALKRASELEGVVQRFKDDQNRIEEGIIAALDRLNQFEDAIGKSLSSVHAVVSSGLSQELPQEIFLETPPAKAPEASVKPPAKPLETLVKPPETPVKPPETLAKPQENLVKPPETPLKAPEAPAKPPETSLKPPEMFLAKPPETSPKPLETLANPSEAPAKPPEASVKLPEAPVKPPEVPPKSGVSAIPDIFTLDDEDLDDDDTGDESEESGSGELDIF